MLRFPNGMRERIKRSADANGRTMNAEIVAVLLEHFPEPLDAFETLVQDVLEALSRSETLSAGREKHQEQTIVDDDALTDLLERVRQEVERRRT